MEMNPQRVRGAEFKTVRKGADPDEVRVFLGDVADELERAQNQSTAMEARARAAVARLQELSDGARPEAAAPVNEPVQAPVEASVDEADTISRTLLLAQRTADTAVAEARTEAARILQAATDESATTLDSTREMSALLLTEAREEARGVGEDERLAIAGEVDSLMARRDFLESDVDHLETFLVDQRARVRDAATSLMEVAERVPGGLGDIRRPLLSASDDESSGDVVEQDDVTVEGADANEAIADEASTDELNVNEASADEDRGDENAGDESATVESTDADPVVDRDAPGEGSELDDDIASVVAQIAASEEKSEDSAGWTQTPLEDKPNGGDDDDEFRFSFENKQN
jgi:DivIVA domain-containing protein